MARGANCILPVVSVFVNGYVLGIACLWAVGEAGIASVMKAVLPHGVLDIPAACLGFPVREYVFPNIRHELSHPK
jgi:hypothetical protein